MGYSRIVRTTDYGRCWLRERRYDNGRLAIELLSGQAEEIAVLTVNCPECTLEPGEFLVKTWSENEQIAKDALNSGHFADTGKRHPTGYVEAQVWRWSE